MNRCVSIIKKKLNNQLIINIYFILIIFNNFFTIFASVIDNGVLGDPKVDCMEDRVRLTFNTERPFNGRIFVKGMIENDKCVNNYATNSKQSVDFQLINGQCNMRRSRKLGPDQRGVEQSITIIISFHKIFITKIDRAYRCTCFYMEADKVVTNRFDVSMLPTTELIDTARMPLCSYSVRRGSVNGPIVTYATVGEPVFHVWNCDSNMFSMLVHNCFVDDGAGKDRKPLIDEHGCTIDSIIVPELTYNNQANLAYSEVNVFKFADKITTYFQCAVSTCMISEGMCKGKTPPRCGLNNRHRRTISKHPSDNNDIDSKQLNLLINNSNIEVNKTMQTLMNLYDDYVMDLAAEKIIVLDLDDTTKMLNTYNMEMPTLAKKNSIIMQQNENSNKYLAQKRFDDSITSIDDYFLHNKNNKFNSLISKNRVCLSYNVVSFLTYGIASSAIVAFFIVIIFICRQKYINSIKLSTVSIGSKF